MNQFNLGNRPPLNVSPPNSDCEFLNIRAQYEFAIALSKLAAEDHASVLLEMRECLCGMHDAKPDSPCPFPATCPFPSRLCCTADVHRKLLVHMEIYHGDVLDACFDFESRTAMALLAAATSLLAFEASGQTLQ